MTILHVLDHSMPLQSGYSSRSHFALSAFSGIDVDVVAITSPKHGISESDPTVVDGIRYYRSTYSPSQAYTGVIGQLRTILNTRRSVKMLTRQHEISLLHAHSPCLNGFAAIKQKIPFVYEMRSSWEDAAVSNGQTKVGSFRYRLSRSMETYIARNADAVVVICEGLRSELIKRGINSDKIFVVPNAVPRYFFESPKLSDVVELQRKYNLVSKRVIGFFGSFFAWEGIEDLIRAMPGVLRKHNNAVVFLAGGGRMEKEIKNLVRELRIEESVIFAGRLPPSKINACYSATDLMVFPRQSIRLTEMVTPLKPLEAMASSVPVLASDIGGHREQISEGQNGFLFEAHNTDALTEKICELLADDNLRMSVTDKALNWVAKERTWQSVVSKYEPAYDYARSNLRRA